MILTEDLLLRNGYAILILENGKKLFIKKSQELHLFDNEYELVDEKYALCKKYGKWQIFTERGNFYVKTTDNLKNIFDINFDEEKNLDHGFIYIIKTDLGYKIGKTSKIKDRLAFFKITLPFNWSLEALFMVESFSNIENRLHNYLTSRRKQGEWFSLDEDILKKIDIYFKHNYKSENLVVKNNEDTFFKKITKGF